MAGKYRQNYDESKFVGSFDLPSVPFNNRFLPARVRPSADKTYYTVIFNGAFFGHLSKEGDVWKELSGNTEELVSVVGKMIDEHEKDK
jgi:hypothetical protein